MIPVAHDPLGATIIERAGFKVVGCGGYANSAVTTVPPASGCALPRCRRAPQCDDAWRRGRARYRFSPDSRQYPCRRLRRGETRCRLAAMRWRMEARPWEVLVFTRFAGIPLPSSETRRRDFALDPDGQIRGLGFRMLEDIGQGFLGNAKHADGRVRAEFRFGLGNGFGALEARCGGRSP